MSTTSNNTNNWPNYGPAAASGSAIGNGQPPQQSREKLYVGNRRPAYNPFQENTPAPNIPAAPVPDLQPLSTDNTLNTNAVVAPAPFVPVNLVPDLQVPPAPVEPVYVKPEVVLPPSAPDNFEHAKKGSGCNPLTLIWVPIKAFFKLLGMIRNLIFTALIVLVLAIVAVFLILMYRPPVVWNPIKTWLNNGIEKPEYQNIDTTTIFKKISTTALANKPVPLSDSEFTSLMREYTFLGDKCFVAVQDNGLRFYINIDNTERPLWFMINTKLNDKNRFVVDKAGFGLFDTPQQFTSLLTDTMGQLFQFLEKQVTADSSVAAFEEVINTTKLDKNIKLQKVELKKGEVLLYYQNNTPKDKDATLTY